MEKPNIDRIIESEPLEKFGLNFVGIGAENICFETKGSAKKLIKVSTEIFKRKVFELINGGDNNVLFKKQQKELMKEGRQQEKATKEVFGEDHILEKGYFHSKIPLNKVMIIEIMGEDLKREIEDKDYVIEMIMQTQSIAEELKDPEAYKTEDYSTDLITHDDFRNSKNIDEGLKKIETLVDREFISKMRQRLISSNYAETIKEITKKIVQYTKKTGLMLDIFGPNNITIFTDKERKVDFHLIDVVLPGSVKGWGQNIEDDKELGLLRHSYTFYYSIKRLAEEIGLTDNLQPQDLLYFKNNDIPTGDWPSNPH